MFIATLHWTSYLSAVSGHPHSHMLQSGIHTDLGCEMSHRLDVCYSHGGWMETGHAGCSGHLAGRDDCQLCLIWFVEKMKRWEECLTETQHVWRFPPLWMNHWFHWNQWIPFQIRAVVKCYCDQVPSCESRLRDFRAVIQYVFVVVNRCSHFNTVTFRIQCDLFCRSINKSNHTIVLVWGVCQGAL